MCIYNVATVTPTISSHIQQRQYGILRTRIVSKIEDVHGEDKFGFEEEKESEIQYGC
jgi:hypothetical protein